MKKILLGTFIAVLLMGGAALATPDNKVTICHATSSATNPWVRIVVSKNAIHGHFENNGSPKAGHEDDVLLEGDKDCPVKEAVKPTPTPAVSPTPTPTKVTPVEDQRTEEISYGGK